MRNKPQLPLPGALLERITAHASLCKPFAVQGVAALAARDLDHATFPHCPQHNRNLLLGALTAVAWHSGRGSIGANYTKRQGIYACTEKLSSS
jgi:hypothetical protein